MLLLKTLAISLLASFVAASPIAATVAAPLEARQGESPDPREVYIVSVVWNGSGCKMGAQQDTNYQLTPDRQTIQIIYSNYIAQSSPNAAPADQRKNCVLNFRLNIPRDWQYTISQTIFRGFADTGVCTAFIKASYWFSGQTGQVGAQYNFPRGSLGNYEQATTVVAVWPRCNSPTLFNINSEAYISCPRGQSGQLTVDALDHTYRESYRLSWRRCRS